MLKENGRLKPASKSEIASLKKGKNMFCPNCNVYKNVAKVEFASTVCEVCGEQLIDSATASKKATGK